MSKFLHNVLIFDSCKIKNITLKLGQVVKQLKG